jgi:hypothetical protein
MALKYRIAALADVDEKYRDLYTARDGAFFLDAEGATGKDKLDEFRNNNIELKRQLDELAARFTGIDPDEAKRLLTEAQKVKDKKLIDSGKMEEVLAERTAAMKAEHEKQVKALSDQLGTTTSQLEKLLVDNSIQTFASKAGVRETAMEDVLLRGRNLYKVKEGKAVPIAPDGKIIYGKDGVTPQSMEEWLSGLTTVAPHLFKESKGGGADNSTRTGPTGAKTMRRSDFEQLDPVAKQAFIVKDKGQLVD